MTKVEVFAPAKINLALHIIRRRADGYHEVDSLVAFADVGDRVIVADSADIAASTKKARLEIHGPEKHGVPDDVSNLVVRAIDTMVTDVSHLVTLEKNLPAASGIGGGSSDAAAAIRAVALLCGIQLPAADAMRAVAHTLGADVPMCLVPRPWRARGIGHILDPVELPALHAVLANPRELVPTGSVFSALASADNPSLVWPPDRATARGLIDWISASRNDLEPAARSVAPIVGRVLDRLSRLRAARIARMSGSGATCFALFDTAASAEKAAATLRQQEPGWWVHSATLGDMRHLANPRTS